MSTSTGGMHAPDPSKTIAAGSSDAASAAPAGTFDSNGAPAKPPPTLRHPTVRTPATTASSRKSDAACDPASAIAISSSSDGFASATRGSAGPPRPMHTTTGSAPRSRRSAAQCPATAVLPVRLPVAITASFGPSNATGS